MSSNKEGKLPERRGMQSKIEHNQPLERDEADSDTEGIRTDVPAALTEGRGPHWDRIYDNAELTVANAVPETDPFVYNLLQRHFDEMDNMPGMDDRETLVHLITRFVDHLDGTTARQAIIYLARFHWDLDVAMTNFLNGPDGMSAEEISDADTEWGHGAESEEESLDPDPSDTGGTIAEIERINAHIDREPAIKGRRDVGKFVIKINLVGGGEKTLKFRSYNEGDDLDWDNPVHIRDLNRWRSQVFRRNISAAKPRVVPYLPEELGFITQQYTDHLSTHQQQHPGVPVDWHELDWNAITAEFNRRFADTIPQQGGAPRPKRSQASLVTQRYRIQAVCDLMGRAQKTDKTVKGKGRKGDDGKGSDGKGDDGGSAPSVEGGEEH